MLAPCFWEAMLPAFRREMARKRDYGLPIRATTDERSSKSKAQAWLAHSKAFG